MIIVVHLAPIFAEMDPNVLKKPRLALSITSCQNLSLDLWKGFSNTVCINVQLSETTLSSETPPLIGFISACLDWYKVPSLWAFTDGPLAIWDQSGRKIDITSHLHACSESSEPDAVQYVRGKRINSYEIDRLCQRLLKVLRSKLKTGISYCLSFREKTYPMRAARCDSHSRRLHPGADDCWVDVECEDSKVWFDVLASTPPPRLQAALSTCKILRPNDAHPVHWITIKVTSLDKKPIRVKMPDPNLEMNHTGLSSWLKLHDLRKRYVSNSLYYGSQGRQQAWQRNKEEILQDCPGVLIFYQGTSWTFYYEPPAKAWYADPNVARDLYIKFVAEQSGFSTWEYLDDGVDHGNASIQSLDNGRIEFDPVLAGWDEIEEMLEREKPLPLFRLPFELRLMIYEYLKFGEDAGLARITWLGEVADL